jgi:dihydrofolate reductase
VCDVAKLLGVSRWFVYERVKRGKGPTPVRIGRPIDSMAKAQELAGNRMVEVASGDVGGQVLAAGLIDEVRMDVVPVVFGSGKRYFGSVHAQHLLEEPDVVIQGNRVLHLRYRVRRSPI